MTSVLGWRIVMLLSHSGDSITEQAVEAYSQIEDTTARKKQVIVFPS
jgi:hypothetical protein